MNSKKYGRKFADVCVSFNRAREAVGGVTLTVDEILSISVEELFDEMARNRIRFIANLPREKLVTQNNIIQREISDRVKDLEIRADTQTDSISKLYLKIEKIGQMISIWLKNK